MFKITKLNAWIEDKRILEDINLEVRPGEIVLIAGPNGSGKTTLARAILNDPKIKKEGKIILGEKDITNLPTHEISKYIYLAFQYPPDIEFLLTKDFLKEMGISDEIYSLFDYLSLPKDILDRGLLTGFSGGERKKFEILLSLLKDYNVYIFDEPDSGLDSESISKLSKILVDLKNKGKCIIVISHISRLFIDIKPDRVYIIERGRIKKVGGYELLKDVEKYEV
ncbi:MAG: hypothetical protein BXU00_01085 [Candidatus Nanoclepta minutus]|uniref:ABC transporter domain-containing protein n=1 Tax=Candidatus Nanoclepta minutus TaxID=1940235 RepID=A0A397WSN1_9ARCH|nr:MAG: hypothetical protein BXU00_01085 [Candidatus Nanoclepta minutus]